MTDPHVQGTITPDEDRYFGIKDGSGGYDGLILQQFKDGGLTLYYMSRDGWIENNALIEDLHDADTRPISASDAAVIANQRFKQPLIPPRQRPNPFQT
jgi:hypothetical protein